MSQPTRLRTHSVRRFRLRLGLYAALLITLSQPLSARADGDLSTQASVPNQTGETVNTQHGHAPAGSLDHLDVGKDYALGLQRFDLDSHTEMIGWRLNDVWYFGRQDGLDSGLTLVWQSQRRQFSLSKDGLRLTQRF